MKLKRKLKLLCVNCKKQEGQCVLSELPGIAKDSAVHCREINLDRISKAEAENEARKIFSKYPDHILQIIIEPVWFF